MTYYVAFVDEHGDPIADPRAHAITSCGDLCEVEVTYNYTDGLRAAFGRAIHDLDGVNAEDFIERANRAIATIPEDAPRTKYHGKPCLGNVRRCIVELRDVARLVPPYATLKIEP